MLSFVHCFVRSSDYFFRLLFLCVVVLMCVVACFRSLPFSMASVIGYVLAVIVFGVLVVGRLLLVLIVFGGCRG